MTLKINKDDKIWTKIDTDNDDDNSCFNFENTENSLNEFLGETEATEQSGNYTITTRPYVHLIPNDSIYNHVNFSGMNYLSFNIPRFGSKNLTEYIDVINESISTYDLTHNNVFNTQGNTSFDYTTAYPDCTHAYLQNQIFQMYFDINKVFDETMYIIDFTGSIFDEILDSNTMITDFNLDSSKQLVITESAPTYTTSTTNTNTYPINASTKIFTISPRYGIDHDVNELNGNEGESPTEFTIGNVDYLDGNSVIQTLGSTNISVQVDKIINNFIKPAISNYKDPLSGRNTFEDIVISESTRTDVDGNGTVMAGFDIDLQISIKKTLSAKNYNIYFKDINSANLTWDANLKISDKLIGDNSIDTSDYNIVDMNGNYKIYDENEDVNQHVYSIDNTQIDASGNILNSTGNILDASGTILNSAGSNESVSGRIIYKVTPEGNVKISGTDQLISQVGLDINRFNNTFSFKAIEDGVATTTNQK